MQTKFSIFESPNREQNINLSLKKFICNFLIKCIHQYLLSERVLYFTDYIWIFHYTAVVTYSEGRIQMIRIPIFIAVLVISFIILLQIFVKCMLLIKCIEISVDYFQLSIVNLILFPNVVKAWKYLSISKLILLKMLTLSLFTSKFLRI